MNLNLFILSLFLVVLASGNPLDQPNDPSSMIVGGFETTIEENPWQVSVQLYTLHICGGSIINERFVLTSGHCAGGDDIRTYSVRVGSSLREKSGSVFEVKRIIRHENYDYETIDYDFSLLELAKEISFSDKVQPIALPDEKITIEDASLALVSGWGNTYKTSNLSTHLHAVYVPITNQQYCKDQYKRIEKSITERMICAGYEEGLKSPCFGDSGGPLSIEIDDIRVLVGTVSFAYGCAEPSYPEVFGRITSVRSWIRKHTGI